MDIEGYLQPSLGRELLVCISTSDNAGDIEKFVNHEISMFGGWKLISNDTKSKAKKKLVEKSNGMFRWAYLQWKQLKGCRMDQIVLDRLDILPETLSAAYDKIYNSFQPGELESLVLQRTVRWVLYAKRPLETAALLATIEHQRTTVNGGEDEYKPFSKSNLTQLALESVCRDLVVRDPQLDTWGFSHASVAEHFLLKNEPWIENAKSEITISLTHFLIKCCTAFGSVWPPPGVKEEWDNIRSLEHSVNYWFRSRGVDLGEPRDPRHPLQTYTQQEWVKHMSDTSDQDPKLADVTRVLKLFLGQTGPQTSSTEYQVYCKYIMFGQDKQYVEVRKHVQPFQNSTFGIVTLGLTRLLPGWWDQALFPVKLNTHKESLLELAAEFRHASICEDLVLRGFPINRDRDFEDHGWNAFGLAMINENLEVARFLLNNGASPYLPDSPESFKSLFCFAAAKGLEYLQVLLDGGADPNTHCSAICTWGCALSMAAWKGDVRSSEALINAGANANPKCSNCNHRSPLTMAFGTEFPNRNSYLPLVRLLLKHGADANTPMKGEIGWKKYDSMLEATVIVEHGADVKTPLESLGYDTILEYAVMKGDVNFPRFLIEHGADVHSRLKIGKFGSLLAAATVEPDSSLDMVKFLIEEVHADLEQLEWRLSPIALETKSGDKSALWSSLDHAMSGKYLTDVHQVDPQVFLDMDAYYGQQSRSRC
ncbi:unnamed protein product [Fusarium equiseti]|uniref:Ankyrin n=1 Tax=Fusarium equiseti TaxID=61235 RepID=A0A8J2NC02_FUSEQ|nr:unnamed protein product [Fusarium equiseti]